MMRTDSSSEQERAGGEPGGPCMVLGYDRGESARHAADWVTNELLSGGKLVIVYACRPLHARPLRSARRVSATSSAGRYWMS
jgi:hypothetical protein